MPYCRYGKGLKMFKLKGIDEGARPIPDGAPPSMFLG